MLRRYGIMVLGLRAQSSELRAEGRVKKIKDKRQKIKVKGRV